MRKLGTMTHVLQAHLGSTEFVLAWRRGTMPGKEGKTHKERRRGVAVELLSTALPPPAPTTPTHTGLTMGEKLFLFSENSLENPSHTHLLKHKILTLGCACTRANAHRVTEAYVSEQGQCCLAHTPLAIE